MINLAWTSPDRRPATVPTRAALAVAPTSFATDAASAGVVESALPTECRAACTTIIAITLVATCLPCVGVDFGITVEAMPGHGVAVLRHVRLRGAISASAAAARARGTVRSGRVDGARRGF